MGILNIIDLSEESIKTGWPWNVETDSNIYSDSIQWPKISIITPSYNQGNFLEETIRSIILQNYPNLEYIIIDGGSTDNSVEIIKKYEKHITYWVSEKDFGQSHAINKGFTIATGEILNWINSDDIVCKNALFYIADNYLKRKNNNIIIIGNGYEIDENSITTRERKVFNTNDLESNLNLKIKGHPIQQSIFFSKKIFNEVGGISPLIKYPMDIELYYKFSFLNPEIIVIDKFLASFRKHSNSKTISESYRMLIEKINLLQYIKFYDHNQLYIKNQISSYIITFSFKGISINEKVNLCKTFISNTPFNKKNRYKFKILFYKMINK